MGLGDVYKRQDFLEESQAIQNRGQTRRSCPKYNLRVDGTSIMLLLIESRRISRSDCNVDSTVDFDSTLVPPNSCVVWLLVCR